MDRAILKQCRLCVPVNAENPSPSPPGPAKRSTTGIIFEWSVRIEGFERFHDPPGQPDFILEFAFPHHEDTPAERYQRCSITPVAGNVRIKFAKPELTPGLWHNRIAAVSVSVPEAAVDENRSPETRKDDVGLAGQIRPPEREAKTESVNDRPDLQLRTRIPALNAAHIPASMFACDPVGHRSEEQPQVALGFRSRTPVVGCRSRIILRNGAIIAAQSRGKAYL